MIPNVNKLVITTSQYTLDKYLSVTIYSVSFCR